MPYDIFCNVKDISTGKGRGKKVFFQGYSPHLGTVSVFFGEYGKLGKEGLPHPKAGEKYVVVSLARGRKLLKNQTSVLAKKTEINIVKTEN